VAFKYHVGHTALAKDNLDFLGQTLSLWDALGCVGFDFWGLGNEVSALGSSGMPSHLSQSSRYFVYNGIFAVYGVYSSHLHVGRDGG